MTEQEIRKVAAEANVDPRTVHGILDGTKRTYPALVSAVTRALKKLGHVAEATRLEKGSNPVALKKAGKR